MIEADEKPEKIIGKYSNLKIAKEICGLNLENVLKISQKNWIRIQFSKYKKANNLVENEILKNKGYNVYIPYGQVSFKGIVRNIDLELTDHKFKSLMKPPINIPEAEKVIKKNKWK